MRTETYMSPGRFVAPPTQTIMLDELMRRTNSYYTPDRIPTTHLIGGAGHSASTRHAGRSCAGGDLLTLLAHASTTRRCTCKSACEVYVLSGLRVTSAVEVRR